MKSNYPSWILERSFGGLGTAESPTSKKATANWPDGQAAPMAKEACQALVDACNGQAREGDPRCMVFLVGGAGNGKSKLAGDTVSSIGGTPIGEPQPFAQRVYDYRLNSGDQLRVINDATIPPEDQFDRPLIRDLSQTLQADQHLLACINRGVLIGEARAHGDTPILQPEKTAMVIARWLLSGELQSPEVEGWELCLDDAEEFREHYSVATLWAGDKKKAVVHVVYMDSASLLEHWIPPKIANGDYREPLPTGAVEVVPILGDQRLSKPAAFQSCVQKGASAYLASLEGNRLDPIAANARSLSNTSVANGWCSLLRGAEVISGTHFTYRELWALFAHSIVGPINAPDIEALSGWAGERLAQADDKASEERLGVLLSLGAARTHMLLFDAGRAADDQVWKVPHFVWPSTESDALRSIRMADPLRSFGPASGTENAEIANLLAGIEEGQLPGQRLADEDEAIGDYWSPLDAEIERAIKQEIDTSRDTSTLKKRNWLLSWYGRYMYRLIGLVRGWPAHCSVISEWQRSWLDADKRNRLSKEMEDAILDIIAPSSGRGDESYFTFLQPRVDAGEGSVERALIALPRNHFVIQAKTAGGRVELQINQAGREGDPQPASTLLDFHMLREAMARLNGHGFTDSLMLIEPRIERIRASLVTHQLSQPDHRHRFKFTHRGQPIVTR